MTASVRAATEADAAAIVEIRNAAWRAAYGAYLPEDVWADIDVAAVTARFARRLADRTITALVAELDSTVHAYVLFGPSRDDDVPDAGEVYALYARPERWSTGLGRTLLPEAIAALDTKPVVLWVLEVNARARRFYDIAGFRPDGGRKPADLLGGVQLPELRYRLD